MSGIIDTRDLERELSELLEGCACPACDGTGEIPESELENGEEKGDECPRCEGYGHVQKASEMPEDDPDRERAIALEEAREEIGEWYHGETLIPDDEFEDYARELAESIGAIDSDAGWPLSYIDWSRAADALRMDYTSIEIDGTDYLYRYG